MGGGAGGAVDEAGDLAKNAKNAGVGRGRGQKVFKGRTERRLVALAQHPLRCLGPGQDITRVMEAVVADHRCRNAGVRPRRLGDRSLDDGLGVGDRPVGIDPDPDFHDAFGRYAGHPFAPADLAEVEANRMGMRAIGRVLALLCIPLRFQRLQAQPDGPSPFDGVDPGRVGAGGVGRVARHSHLEPKQPHLGADEALVHRLWDQGRVGGVAPLQAGQSAIARALLLDHGLEEDLAPGP